MLLMPRIQRRHIDRLKSSRSIRVHETEPVRATDPNVRPQYTERRVVKERRQRNVPVAYDRRRQDRRNARKALRPEIRAMLENAGDSHPANRSRGGVFIDEDV